MNSGANLRTGGGELASLLETAGVEPLSSAFAAKFEDYLTLLLRWNARTNLTAVRDPQAILRRHFVESIICARALPIGIGSLLDFGTGAGFPGIPIALCRPEIAVTLAESQSKKIAFLREAVRVLGLNVTVFGQRAEGLTQQFDCVTLRAVDRMEQAVSAASRLVGPGGWVVAMTTDQEFPTVQVAVGEMFISESTTQLPGSEHGLIAIFSKTL